ncbi:trypsin-like peptidase domain-containing protein [Flavicella sediminum]|uniref:trypsin-like peptidase domain-containing protein n=1 Tax=Flavicella sediminum TaxID=2585141 RepID=UPI00111EBC64|nr:trypsin-like peptidase domain-containing protein [Flavicella sediminum]
MKKTANLVFVAFLGGAISLGGYKLFVEKNSTTNETVSHQVEDTLVPIQTNFSYVNSIAAEKTDFVTAADKSLNAVVHVKNTSVQNVRDPFAELFYGRSQGRKYEQVGTGSGVLISSDGYVITNNHVIDNATDIEITLNNKKVYKATLIGADPSNDIALVKIEGAEFDYIPFANSDNVKVGEWVLAVGNPYNLTSTVTAGIISAKGRDLEGNSNIESFIQTDAAVNPGNSGGALVNTRGELVGINTAISSKTGAFVGYSFAVPSNIAKKVVEDLMEYGNVQKALIGIQYDPSKDDLEGVRITAVTENGGAKKAGLQEEDVIVKINDVKITKFSDLKGQLNAKRPGDKINVTVLRGDKKLTKVVELTENRTAKINAFGFSLEKLSPKEAKKLNNHGVKISKIQNEELLSLGVEEGAVLVEINGKEIKTIEEAEQMLNNRNRGYLKLGILNLEGEKENYIFR